MEEKTDNAEALERIFKAAEQGDIDAQFKLGVLYDKGEGVTQDYAKAAEWFRKAAEQGDMLSQFNLGLYYAKSIGVPQDYAQAAMWYCKAAEQGDAEAQFQSGLCYALGRGVPQDYTQAAMWYRKAAEQGVIDAQFNLGALYAKGDGVPQSNTKAAFLFRKAAEQGDPVAQYNMGICCGEGRGVTKDDAQAAVWFLKAAEQGHMDAQFNLGAHYYKGTGVTRDDTQAAFWFRKAAEQGDATSQYNIGVFCEKGEGVSQDYVQAAEWFRKAADQGDADAQYKSGNCYDAGQGVPQDNVQAAMWYRKAAEQGHADAQYNLGMYYEYGDGVPQDNAQAAEWFRKAADQGDTDAQHELDKLCTEGESAPVSLASPAAGPVAEQDIIGEIEVSANTEEAVVKGKITTVNTNLSVHGGEKYCLTCANWDGNRTGEYWVSSEYENKYYSVMCTADEKGICNAKNIETSPKDGMSRSHYYPYNATYCPMYKVISVDDMLRMAENREEALQNMETINQIRAVCAYGETAKEGSGAAAKDALISRWSADCKNDKVMIIVKGPKRGSCWITDEHSYKQLSPESYSPCKLKFRLSEPQMLNLRIKSSPDEAINIMIFVCPGDTYELTKDGKAILQTSPCQATGGKTLTFNLELRSYEDIYYITAPPDDIFHAPVIERCDYCVYYDRLNMDKGCFDRSFNDKKDWEPSTHTICSKWNEMVDGNRVCDEFNPSEKGPMDTVAYLTYQKDQKWLKETEKQRMIMAKIEEEISEAIDRRDNPISLNPCGSIDTIGVCPTCGNEHTTRYCFFVSKETKARASATADLALAFFARIYVIRDADAYMNHSYCFRCEVQVCDECGYWEVVDVKDA